MAAFRLADRWRRPVSELNITLEEFNYWLAFYGIEYPQEGGQQTPEQQLAIFRGLTDG